MTDRGPHDGPRPTRLERPAGGAAWRISAIVVVGLLVAIVAVGRLGMEPPASSLGPSPSPAAAALASPTTAATPSTAPPAASPEPASPGAPIGPASGVPLPLASRYADGVPLAIGGERVLRLPNALTLEPGSTFLVGGWYQGPDCGGLGHGGACPRGRLADGPAGFARRGQAVDLTGVVEEGTGARVFRARTEPPECAGGRCRPVLAVEDVVWRGDPLTDAGPVDVVPLMSALGFAFPDMGAVPYRDLPQCPMPWPPQTFRSPTTGPRLTLVFPSTRDREDAQAAIRAGRSLLLAEQGGECIAQAGRFRGAGRWLAEANVMLLLQPTDAATALARAALADALTQSDGDEQAPAADQPITTWQALRRVWRVEPALDLAERLVEAACGAALPDEAYALRHPEIRTLLVFDTRADRRRFERRVAPGALATASTDCAATGPEPVGATYRWISFANVLLEVRGAEWIDEPLAEALRGTGTP